MCLNPKWIYKKGNYKENNYRGYKNEFYEIGTYSKCGCCEVCINEKMNNWVIRNTYEAKRHKRKCFITLTYEDNSIILVKKDFQDWLKRFRRELEKTTGEKIRYFEADEYGFLNNRPHAHFIIYGWDDKNAKYLTINKKKQIVYQSEIIQKTWGLGRTSYQPFGDHEIPYLTLYETPQEQFKKAYKLNFEKLKKIEKLSMNIKNKNQLKNLQEALRTARRECEESKNGYTMIKERNSWSKALGWEKFYEEYAKTNNYTWTEYIEGTEFVTPSPWVKKLANMGDIAAAKEMKRREELIEQSTNEKEERLKNLLNVSNRRKKEIIEWKTQKTEIEDF